jgi:hypothetical protein
MSATITRIFTGGTNPAAIDETATFSNADFVFFSPQGVGEDQYEIAGSLIIDLVGTEELGGVPISTTYGTREIPLELPVFDTAFCVPIPREMAHTSLNMRLTISTSYSISVDIYAVSSGVSLQSLSEQIEELRQQQDAQQVTLDDLVLLLGSLPVVI